jgi:hypothetical protein
MSEQNELLEATEKLLEILAAIDDTEGLTEEEMEVIADTRKIVDQHRPKPKRLEGWLNLYGRGDHYMGFIWPTEQSAKDHASPNMLSQVHIREVIPVGWGPWTVEMVRNHRNFQETVDAHNAEMERVTK